MEPLQWVHVLLVFTSQAMPTYSGQPSFIQSPDVISLMKVNSSAEIRCLSDTDGVIGLSLRRRYLSEDNILYLSIPHLKTTFNSTYLHRLSVTGSCCDFTFHLSQLMVEDTDGYYCTWTRVDSQTHEVMKFQGNDTIIIVRERDPREKCSRNVALYRLLVTLSASTLVVMASVFTGAIIWCCTRTKEKYSPVRAHQQHHAYHPQRVLKP